MSFFPRLCFSKKAPCWQGRWARRTGRCLACEAQEGGRHVTFSGCVPISGGRKVMESFPMPSGIGFCKINLCPSTNLQTGCQWKSRRFLQQTMEFLWLPTATKCIANGFWDGYILNDPVWMKSTAKVMNLYNATQEGRALCWHDHDYNLRWWDVIWRIQKLWEV